MAEDEERLTESNSHGNTISELPAKPFTITTELPLFLIMLGLALSGAAISNIILYRTCIHSLHHSEDECKEFLSPDRSNNTQQLEQEVQKYVTVISTLKLFLESVGPAILSLFLGVWSDTYGRKPLVVWPLFGLSVSSMMTVVFALWNDLGPWWHVLTVIPFSLTGGFTALFTGAFCYVSDITNTENRSIRMAVIEASFSAGSIVGAILSSYLLKAVGNVYLLVFVTALYVTAYAFTNVCLSESLNGALEGGLSTLLDFLLVKEMIRECFKERPNRGRAQIFLLTIANTLSLFILYGLVDLDYMYTREKLHWSLKSYTMFSGISTLISFVGVFLGVTFVQKILRVGDVPLAIVGYLSSTTEYVIKAFAVKSWHLYMGAGVSMFKGLPTPLIRSFVTKILPVEDIAKVFALMCAVESICPLIAPALYNSLYAYTISTFPGAVYILSCMFTSTCMVLLGFVIYYRWNNSSTYQSLVEQPSL